MFKTIKYTVALALSGVAFFSSAAYAATYKAEAHYHATRCKKKVLGVCIPEFKQGHYIAYGSTCGEAFGKGRRDATRAGGWSIKNEWGRKCERR